MSRDEIKPLQKEVLEKLLKYYELLDDQKGMTKEFGEVQARIIEILKTLASHGNQAITYDLEETLKSSFEGEAGSYEILASYLKQKFNIDFRRENLADALEKSNFSFRFNNITIREPSSTTAMMSDLSCTAAGAGVSPTPRSPSPASTASSQAIDDPLENYLSKTKPNGSNEYELEDFSSRPGPTRK